MFIAHYLHTLAKQACLLLSFGTFLLKMIPWQVHQALAFAASTPDRGVTPAHQNAVFTYDERPFVNVMMMGKDRQFHPVKLMVDSGNDLTLISQQTAHELGYSTRDGEPFHVAGISQTAQDFSMINTMIRIGSYPPIHIGVGIGDVKDNLLGRQDVYNHYDITFGSHHTITFANADPPGYYASKMPEEID